MADRKGIVEAVVRYYPRPQQRKLHDSLKRFNVLVCHRRFGKTVFCINEMLKKAVQCPRKRPQYAFIAPFLKQAKRNVWADFKYFVANIPGAKINEAELTIELPSRDGGKSKIYLLGADNPDALRGMYLDGVVLDEVAQIPQHVWEEVIRPTLADRRGWAIFIGTPKGQNYFHELYKGAKDRDNWYRAMYKASETNIISQEELTDIRSHIDEDSYNQEYECSFVAAIKGAYYSKLLAEASRANRIAEVEWDPTLPVVTAWDIGMSDKTCIWFAQKQNNNIYLVDYYEASGEVLAHYAQIVTSKPYTYMHHILPHDAQQRSFDTGKTRVEQLRKLGLKCTIAPKTGILDGINAVRAILPKCHFDEKKCKNGLEALWHYRSEYDPINHVFQNKPLHDWSSHASDAFRYLAIGMRQNIPTVYEQTQIQFKREFAPHKLNVTDWDPFGDIDNDKIQG